MADLPFVAGIEAVFIDGYKIRTVGQHAGLDVVVADGGGFLGDVRPALSHAALVGKADDAFAPMGVVQPPAGRPRD